PHPGIIFIPMGPWANQIINPSSESCGTPEYKGINARVEAIPDGKVLDALELIRKLTQKK
ncbi:MAG: molybdopterin dinucleotide-binding protein, partial [Candidatus Lokiarchaeota archaeon]|nr:molybdopterin dinucleotide-binding protein [Candidatus Lokiarchaeota archaeon]